MTATYISSPIAENFSVSATEPYISDNGVRKGWAKGLVGPPGLRGTEKNDELFTLRG